MKKIQLPLVIKVLIAIVLGVALGQFMPGVVVRATNTFTALFDQLLKFFIPLIIVGLVTSAIADVGRVEKIDLSTVNKLKEYIPDRGFPDNIKDEKGPREFSLSAGFAIPITNSWNNRSLLNISAQWVNSSSPSFIKENSFRVNIGLTFNERWFAKWKVD